jgi:hypothetical protein
MLLGTFVGCRAVANRGCDTCVSVSHLRLGPFPLHTHPDYTTADFHLSLVANSSQDLIRRDPFRVTSGDDTPYRTKVQQRNASLCELSYRFNLNTFYLVYTEFNENV